MNGIFNGFSFWKCPRSWRCPKTIEFYYSLVIDDLDDLGSTIFSPCRDWWDYKLLDSIELDMFDVSF